MKFSQLVIASAAIAAGVKGFSTSKLSVVRQVSKSSIVYWKLFVIAYWNKKREQWGEIWETYCVGRIHLVDWKVHKICAISLLCNTQWTMKYILYAYVINLHISPIFYHSFFNSINQSFIHNVSI